MQTSIHTEQQKLITTTLSQIVTQELLNTAIGSDSLFHTTFNNIALDSRKVSSDDVFVLLASQTGNIRESSQYLLSIIDTTAFVISEIEVDALIAANVTLQQYKQKLLYIADIRLYLGDVIQAHSQQQQSAQLPTVIAVTGTNGKTTISQLVAQMTENTGRSSAVMGTAGNGKLGQLEQSTHTTGDVLAIQNFLHTMAVDKVQLLALEASSHGLDQHRLQAVPVQIAIYTNLSRDHLDYHSDMEDYARAKARLFDRRYFPKLTHVIINIDDDYADIMLNTAKESGVKNIWTYSLQAEQQATFVAKNIQPSLLGVDIDVHSVFGDVQLQSPLLGYFNVANLLAAIAGVLALGIELTDISELVSQLKGADGRMDRVASDTGCFIVDYAHTPDALTQVLVSLQSHCEGQLWAVFGCGGDRDRGKRPLMAQAGLRGADRVVLTADNPRSENPEDILQDMQIGITDEQYARIHIENDRRAAIEYVVNQAKAHDIVVIAGKGHETYQEVNGVRYDFDDRAILQEVLRKK